MEHSRDVLNYAVFHIYLGGGGNVRIYSCRPNLLPTSMVILPNSHFNNIISESACFAKFITKCARKRNKLVYLKKKIGTSCHRTSLTFYETIYSLLQNYTKM